MAELERQARANKNRAALPERQHLKTQLSRWENGHVVPGEMYRALFRAIYRTTDEALGFPSAPSLALADAADLLTQIATARAIGPTSAGSFAAQVETIRVLDRQLGAPTALAQLRAVTQSVEGLLRHAVLPAAREPLAAVLADAAALAGWQALDMGDVKQAWTLHETAKAAAREAGDAPGLAHAMGQQAYVLLDAGATGDAVQLIRATTEVAGRKSPTFSERGSQPRRRRLAQRSATTPAAGERWTKQRSSCRPVTVSETCRTWCSMTRISPAGGERACTTGRRRRDQRSLPSACRDGRHVHPCARRS